jgi:hypothetical protein
MATDNYIEKYLPFYIQELISDSIRAQEQGDFKQYELELLKDFHR